MRPSSQNESFRAGRKRSGSPAIRSPTNAAHDVESIHACNIPATFTRLLRCLSGACARASRGGAILARSTGVARRSRDGAARPDTAQQRKNRPAPCKRGVENRRGASAGKLGGSREHTISRNDRRGSRSAEKRATVDAFRSRRLRSRRRSTGRQGSMSPGDDARAGPGPDGSVDARDERYRCECNDQAARTDDPDRRTHRASERRIRARGAAGRCRRLRAQGRFVRRIAACDAHGHAGKAAPERGRVWLHGRLVRDRPRDARAQEGVGRPDRANAAY